MMKIEGICKPSTTQAKTINFPSVLLMGRQRYTSIATNILWQLLLLFVPKAAFGDAILFAYAFDEDLRVLKQYKGNLTREQCGPIICHSLQSDKNFKIYCVKLGAGSVQSAAIISAVIAKYPVSLAIIASPAGGLSPIVERKKWYDVKSVVAYQRSDSNVNKNTYNLKLLTENDHGIVVASGEAFLSSDSDRSLLQSEFSADAIDMNLFGVSAACRMFGVPVIARIQCSDYADDTAGQDFAAFKEAYKGEGATWFLYTFLVAYKKTDPLGGRNELKKLIDRNAGNRPF